MIFTQRDGKIGLFYPGTGKIKWMEERVTGIKHGGQGGMLDVAVPGDYTAGDWIYFTYSKDVGGKGVTTLARARRENTLLKDWQDIVVTRSATGKKIHYGSRIAFDNSGHVYFSVGDRGYRPGAQNLLSHAGSILRVNPDGSAPVDNPFFGMKNSLPEIFSFGHRNPQGIVYDSAGQRLWAIEHGPRGGDEINLILPGRNYGWPVISYGKEYWGPVSVGEGKHKKGMEQPVKYYDPSIAPGSLLLYTGAAFPEWQGNLMAGALKLQHLNRLDVDASGKIISEERLLESLDVRIRALAQSPEGWLYFSSDDGRIFRIKPVGLR
jgi:glucose/arabinose dehydrogenase